MALTDAEHASRQAKFRSMLRQEIIDKGWMVVCVFPVREQGTTLFAYTIGLTEAGLPELLISGDVEPDLLHDVLNKAAKQHLRDELLDGASVHLEGIPTPLKVVCCGASAPIQQARDHYADPDNRHRRVKALQLLWPDHEHEQVLYTS